MPYSKYLDIQYLHVERIPQIPTSSGNIFKPIEIFRQADVRFHSPRGGPGRGARAGRPAQVR